MIEKNIVLIGFMGSGKTSVGSRLANMLSTDFYDTDILIEQHMDMSIPKIFKVFGENIFRDKEKQMVEILYRKTGAVISTGGGIVLQPYNMMLLRETGKIIWLKTSLENILSRLKGQASRPKLYNKNFKQINDLYNKRNILYSRYADISVDTNGKTIDEVAREIYKIVFLNLVK